MRDLHQELEVAQEVLAGKGSNWDVSYEELGDFLGVVRAHGDHLEDFVDPFVEVIVLVEDHGAGRQVLLLSVAVLEGERLQQVVRCVH